MPHIHTTGPSSTKSCHVHSKFCALVSKAQDTGGELSPDDIKMILGHLQFTSQRDKYNSSCSLEKDIKILKQSGISQEKLTSGLPLAERIKYRAVLMFLSSI